MLYLRVACQFQGQRKFAGKVREKSGNFEKLKCWSPWKSNLCTPGFKLKVISFAEESNNCATSHQFRIYDKLIHNCRIKKKLEIIPNSKKVLRHGKSAYLELENILHDWIVECQQNGFIGTRTSILTRLVHYCLYYCIFCSKSSEIKIY